MWTRCVLFSLFSAIIALAQPARVLYVTHSAGFRHDCIPLSAEMLQQVASASGKLEIAWTEDAADLTAANLRNFAAVLFYTSGELPLSDRQKQDLLDFVARGGGFGGVHSATDTLYGWEEYGQLIGGYFDGHPWVQDVRIDIEDPDHPAMRDLAPGFNIVEEIYQFRNLSRDRVRVLMTLDAASVDLNAPGVHPGTTDFPLAWTRIHGNGRVFYTALGHFEQTWRSPSFQRLMLNALLWITKQVDGSGEPRPPAQPQVDFVANAADGDPKGIVAPGSLISIYGRNLTPGSTSASDWRGYARKLGGTVVTAGGRPAPLLYASPAQLNAFLPNDVTGPDVGLRVSHSDKDGSAGLTVVPSTPAIFTVFYLADRLTIWATGLGKVREQDGLLLTEETPDVRIAGVPARVTWSGTPASSPGLYSVSVEIPATVPRGSQWIELKMPGSDHVARYNVTLP